jgi:N-acetylmuramoyl-L-alanine amidase
VQKRIFSILICMLLILINGIALAEARVTDVNWGVNRRNVLRFTLDLSEKADYSISIDGKNLMVTVEASAAPGLVRSAAVKSDLASRMYVDRDEHKTTLRVPLNKAITDQQYKSFYLKNDPKNKRPPRVVVDITANEVEAAPVKVETKTINYRTSGGLKGKVITLDPGHGGSDPGAIGNGGLREKNVTLQISQKLQKLLQDAGATVYMTRVRDVDVYGPNASDRAELQARVDVGTAHAADAFVSIHINANNSPSIGGFSTYYSPKTSYDYKLARCIHSSIVKNFGLDDLGVRQAGFYVTKHSLMPAVLIENCFITNPREEKLLQSSWFQGKIAKTIYDGLAAYFN